MKFIKALVLIAFCAGDVHADGGISRDLMRFFKNAGVASNVSTPGAYNDQRAGYYTGGSLSARTGVRNTQIASVQMPGFRAGCGGIDMWAGGFSHIQGAQLRGALKNIASNATSYAFMLMIQSISPQMYGVMNELNALATQINSMNINSCEAAATALGGVWPRTDASSKMLCQAMGTGSNAFSDYAAARQGCGAGGQRNEINDNKDRDDRYKDIMAGEFNLTWSAIQKNAFLASDRDLSHLLMTLVGTIIIQKSADGESYEVRRMPALLGRDDLMNALLRGGSTEIYKCRDTTGSCLNISREAITIREDSAIFNKTVSTLSEIVRKMYDDIALTDEEKAFIESTKLPVYKMLNVMTAFKRGRSPIDVHQYAEMIALDIVHKYILEVIDIVNDSVQQLKAVQVSDDHIKDFMAQLQEARKRILDVRHSSYERMHAALQMIKSTQMVEKQLHSMMGSMPN